MFYCVLFHNFMFSFPLTKFKKVVSFVKTIVCATLGLITESCPSLTTCVIFGELGLKYLDRFQLFALW